jgi:hypothetical protein
METQNLIYGKNDSIALEDTQNSLLGYILANPTAGGDGLEYDDDDDLEDDDLDLDEEDDLPIVPDVDEPDDDDLDLGDDDLDLEDDDDDEDFL